jgi:hypothetical protein
MAVELFRVLVLNRRRKMQDPNRVFVERTAGLGKPSELGIGYSPPSLLDS